MVLGLIGGLVGALGGGGAVAAAGASLVGGVLDRRANAKQYAKSSYMNSPQGIRANAEEAGFNPLLFAGPGAGTGAGYAPQNTWTNAFSAAGNSIADGIHANKQLEIQKSQLEAENERLRQLNQRTSFRPQTPGLYQGRSSAENRTGVSLRNGPLSGLSPASGAGLSFGSILRDNPVYLTEQGNIAEDVGGVSSALPGISPESAVRGTVPYVGAAGDVVPGPNPETQMGIDEVAGWAAMEAFAGSRGLVLRSRASGLERVWREEAQLLGRIQRAERAARGGSHSSRVTRNPPRDRYYYQQNPRRF